MFIKDVFKEFLFDLEARDYSPRTIKGYRSSNRRFLDYLIQKFELDELEQIQSKHIKSYLIHVKCKERSETYINNILKSIRAFLRYCVEEDYLEKDKNPVLKVKWLKEQKTVIRTFTDEEVQGMVDAYDTKSYLSVRNKVIMLMLVDIGIRNYELCTLTNTQVMDDTVLIRGKGKKERLTFISKYLKKYMIKYERARESYFKDRIIKHDTYFLSRNGRPLTVEAVERVVKIAGEYANVRKEIRCSPHTLRHYFSQSMLKRTDVYSLSRLLGHFFIFLVIRIE